jgi:hypothetical protein
MSIVQEVIRKLTNTIPTQLLYEAFTYDYHSGPYRQLKMNNYLPLTTHIEDDVWLGMVYHDINSRAGQSMEVDLGGLTPKPYVHTRLGNLTGMVFHVPSERRDNRNIISVRQGSNNIYNLGGNLFSGASQSTLMEGLLGKMLDHTAGMPGMTLAPTVAYLGGNNILVYGNYVNYYSLRIRCEIENDVDLLNFQRSTSNDLYLLMEQATKMMIFQRLALPVDQAKMVGGFEIGRFREILDGYSDADKLYQEQLEEWGKVAHFNDDEDYQIHLNLISGGLA